jgi:hypothetical protein
LPRSNLAEVIWFTTGPLAIFVDLGEADKTEAEFVLHAWAFGVLAVLGIFD